MPGAAVVVVVAGAHNSSQRDTQDAKTVGFVGQSLMHACKDPPGQSLGTGVGAGGEGAGGVGAGGEGAGAGVVVLGHSSLHTETQASYAAPETTAHASSQALNEPPGHPEGDGGEGGAGGLGAGGVGAGGVGLGAGVGGTSGFVVSRSPTFRFKKEYEESGCASRSVSGLPTAGSHGPRLQPGSVGSQSL